MADTGKHIAIIGAGIIGVSTAIWLQRAGHRVTLIDRQGPAAGTSYGNAGVLAANAVIPVPVPGLIKKAPKMLFSPSEPLFLRWSYLPKLLPFLMRYLPQGRDHRVKQISKALTDLLYDSADQHLALAAGTGAEHFIKPGDYVFGYKDRAAFEKDQYSWSRRRALGYEFQIMEAAEFSEFDPAMAGRFGYAVRCPHHGRISDPGAYVKTLSDHVVKQGGNLIICEVTDIVLEGARAKAVETKEGKIEADEIVIATGIWSGPLAKKLGVNVPFEAERGYHIEFVNPSLMPKGPTMVAAGKFVMTPMEGRLRCAGIVEFGGLTPKRSRAPLELLKRQTRDLMPELTYDRIDEWMGYRPSTSDSLPLIGSLANIPNVWTGFGHQHIGLTGGPKTGRWLSHLINGKRPNSDLMPFAPDRFGS